MKAKDLAHGKWRSVLSVLGVNAKSLDGQHHACPATGQGEDRFRFADRNGSGNFFCDCSKGDKGGMALLMCCRNLAYAEACKEVERVVGNTSADELRERRDPRIALNRVKSRVKRPGPAVMRYLEGRGLELAPALREARLRYWQGKEDLGVFDCMVACIHSATGKPESYHLTYLQDGKKADLKIPRKVMTPVETITGGAIRLYPAAEKMGIAEGIETAIAAHMLSGLPVWAAVSAGGVESFRPPVECEHLTIFGDADTSFTGQAAAYALAKRMARSGIACEVRMPSVGDWNDELLRTAA